MQKKKIVLVMAVLLFTGSWPWVAPAAASWAGIPRQIHVFPGVEFSLYVQAPFRLLDQDGADVTGPERIFQLVADGVGVKEFELRLFGFIPVQRMVVHVVDQIEVFPGGHSIGVLLQSKGLVVSGIASVQGVDGLQYQPAADAGLQVGDVLMAIEGVPLRDPNQASQLINSLAIAGQDLRLEIERDGKRMVLYLEPIQSSRSHWTGSSEPQFLLGLHLTDPSAGVGTVTFVEPRSRRYGALGHTITDNLGRRLDVGQGSIVEAFIEQIRPGIRGTPGEKQGAFVDHVGRLGSIDRNTDFGIFGFLDEVPKHPHFHAPIPIAFSHQIELGPAIMYTVVEGSLIEPFAIEITSIAHQRQPADKGLVIEVTDRRLLQLTGGIVQGMSGSPIVQNGTLIGAVTHVFVNDPTGGYGSLIEWMIYDAEIEKNVA